MTDRPIPFTASMVRAILAGTKTQTRRPMKSPRAASANANKPGQHAPIEPYTDGRGSWNFVLAATGHGLGDPFRCPYGVPGDRLWVREAWRSGKIADRFPPRELTPHPVWYEADGEAPEATNGKLRPGMFMPRWASRITIEVVSVRVERLNDISRADARAEGAPPSHRSIDAVSRELGYADFTRSWYAQLWDSINGPGSWAANPWVWAVEFKRAEP